MDRTRSLIDDHKKSKSLTLDLAQTPALAPVPHPAPVPAPVPALAQTLTSTPARADALALVSALVQTAELVSALALAPAQARTQPLARSPEFASRRRFHAAMFAFLAKKYADRMLPTLVFAFVRLD